MTARLQYQRKCLVVIIALAISPIARAASFLSSAKFQALSRAHLSLQQSLPSRGVLINKRKNFATEMTSGLHNSVHSTRLASSHFPSNDNKNSFARRPTTDGDYSSSSSTTRTHLMLKLRRPSTGRISYIDSSATESSISESLSTEKDNSEWQTLVAAFQMYKAAYGDLKVPSRFVVPSMPPWPESAWNLKLGQRVASIRATGKYVDDNQERRKTLEDLGFLWRLRAASSKNSDARMDNISLEQVCAALETYRKVISDDMKIPNSFVVPDCDPWPENTRGMPLGKKIPTIRSKVYLKANPGAEEKFIKLGLELDGKLAANDVRYQKVYNALARYAEIHGDLIVPQPFVVPEGDAEWPESMWGLRLGARVNAIRSQGTFVKAVPSRKDELDSLGFVWDLPTDGNGGKRRGRKKKVINAAFEDLPAEGIFQVGETGDGSKDANEGQATFPWMEDATYGAGQPQEGKSPNLPEWASNPSAPALFPDQLLSVPSETLESAGPSSEDANLKLKSSPEFQNFEKRAEAKGLASGIVVTIEEGPHSHPKLEPRIVSHPWYFDDYGDDFTFENVLEALQIWGENNDGTFDIHDQYILQEPVDVEAELLRQGLRVPVEDEPGSVDAPYEVEVGVSDIDENDDLDGASNAPMSSSSDVSIDWPPHLVGLELGSIVRRIREGDVEVKTDPERRKALDEINFTWGNEDLFIDIPFEKVMCALFAYYQIRGDLFVYEDFVLPGEDPWPKSLAGYELGKMVFKLREKQDFFETNYPEKKSMLDMLEFVWFPKYEPFGYTEFEQKHIEIFGYAQPKAEVRDWYFEDYSLEDLLDPEKISFENFNLTKVQEFYAMRDRAKRMKKMDLDEDDLDFTEEEPGDYYPEDESLLDDFENIAFEEEDIEEDEATDSESADSDATGAVFSDDDVDVDDDDEEEEEEEEELDIEEEEAFDIIEEEDAFKPE
eukprot:CAMPEP_0195524990 /NCGR_PEP_ID=MMETSP0794_2-20130614/25162_1 /TAXON_ID=515487 /ORGANISM="Stephanopyxis turris, Strain CCMP 815" /LENGTH=947 /DNA_ID=CAMNT_0040655341 /DNA_START=72 /DNA_END=2915 /DNA_ORIENTATION=+